MRGTIQIRLLTVVLAVTCALLSCRKQSTESNDLTMPKLSNDRIKAQLDSAMQFGNSNTELNLKLISYKFLDGKAEKNDVKERILNKEAVIPVISENEMSADRSRATPSFEYNTLTEADSKKKTTVKGASYRGNIERVIDTLWKNNSGLVELTWNGGGKTFKSLALYDAKGLMYDNILSNVFTLRDGRAQEKSKSVSQSALTPRQQTVVLHEMFWYWGSVRGRAYVGQTIFLQNGKIVSQSVQTNSWIIMGSSDAVAQGYTLTPDVATLTYAWYLATPTLSITVTRTGQPTELGLSITGFGSRCSGSGLNSMTRY